MGALNWTAMQPFGARVELDLAGDVEPAAIEQLRQLYDTCRLLVFTGQKLSHTRQASICAWFGEVIATDEPAYLSPDPDVGGLGDAELPFHSDLSCTPEPLTGLSLHAIDVDPQAPPTFFVDAIAAAAALPADLREQLATLHVMNLWPMDLSIRQRSGAAPEGWPGTAHPLLRPHRRTGELLLSLNASHSDRIVELDAGASERIIAMLFERLYAPARRLEHHWHNGDFLVWDNLALQHARPPVPRGVARTLQRVEMGSASYMELMPPELMAAYNSA